MREWLARPLGSHPKDLTSLQCAPRLEVRLQDSLGSGPDPNGSQLLSRLRSSKASHSASCDLQTVHQWLGHLSSCSPCFQEFTELRKQAASQRRRTQAWLAVAAVLIFAVAGWLWVRTQHPMQPTETAVLDLREFSVGRGQNPTQTDQRPLEIHRSAKHLILDLPIGSKEGTYDLALLSDTSRQIIVANGTAQLQDHIVSLRADVDIGGVPPGLYFLALRQPGLEWTRYPLRVF